MAGALMATLYSSGTAGTLDATQTIKLTDVGGGPVEIVLSEPKLLDDALSDWQTAANASGTLSETYTFSRSGTAVTLAATGNFDYELVGDLENVLGLPATDSGNSSYAGAGTTAFASALLVECAPFELGDRVDLEEFAHGRVDSYVWGNHDLMRALFYVDAATHPNIDKEYLTAGKVRFWQDTNVATAYSAANPAGYVDGYVAAISAPRTEQTDESIIVFTLLIAVGRS